jgi:thiol-disulfide isomerase/thioredoxin
MKKRLIHGFATFYFVAAILIAHNSLVAIKDTPSSSANYKTNVATSSRPLLNSERLDYGDERTDRARARADRADYVVRVWTAEWCGPCKRYKAIEVPTLVKLGFTVEVLDIDYNEAPKSVKSIPTVMLYYKGKLVKQKAYWRAVDIELHVQYSTLGNN